jgi:hypothetical protein
LIFTCDSLTLYSFKSLDFSPSVSTSCFGFRTCFVMLTSNSVIYNSKNTKTHGDIYNAANNFLRLKTYLGRGKEHMVNSDTDS